MQVSDEILTQHCSGLGTATICCGTATATDNPLNLSFFFNITVADSDKECVNKIERKFYSEMASLFICNKNHFTDPFYKQTWYSR